MQLYGHEHKWHDDHEHKWRDDGTIMKCQNGGIKRSFTLQKDISSTYSSLAEESERKKERGCSCICIAVFCVL